MVDATALPVETNLSAKSLAEAKFGTGIQTASATCSGDPASAGIRTQGATIAPEVTPSDTRVILSTGRVDRFPNGSGAANQRTFASTDTAGSNLTMQIAFWSEEYLECVGSGVNDAVGVWINGEKARLGVDDGDISVGNTSPSRNRNLHVDNATGQYNSGMDGFTVTLTLWAQVVTGQVNQIKIGIADGGDTAQDSNLLIAGESIQTAVIAQADAFSLTLGDQAQIDRVGNDTNTAGGTLTIPKINGVPVSAGGHLILPSGLEIVVNADGTITAAADWNDQTGPTSFSFMVMNPDGITDAGVVTGDVAPCFVEGTRIETIRGPVPVEDIAVGDLVLTLDHGFQPVAWNGVRQVPSLGFMAAVRIPAGALGDYGALSVSPQHRLHVTGWRAQVYSGEDEVPVKTIHLVRIIRAPP